MKYIKWLNLLGVIVMATGCYSNILQNLKYSNILQNLKISKTDSNKVPIAKVVKIDETEPSISGNLVSIGSDTLNNLMTLWSESFREQQPSVTFEIEGKGSSTAPVALIEGRSQLAPMSREMKSNEIDKFETKFGYKPTSVRVAVDALVVFVNKDNPIEGMTLQDLDSIFSSTRKTGGRKINAWGQLKGLPYNWKYKRISLYGRNSASGTYGYFKSNVLAKGDYKVSVKEQLGSAAVVQAVGADKYALGYSGVGYKTSGVKVLSLGTEAGQYFPPTVENSISGDYPLARFLYVYINKAPGKPLDTKVEKFLAFVFSKEGQRIVKKDGYYSLPAEVITEQLTVLK